MSNPISNKEWFNVRWAFDWNWISKGIPLQTVCEVGIGPRDISMLPWFEGRARCRRLIGVDPNPEFCAWARKMPLAEIHECAIGPEEGMARLILNGGSSFLDGNWSPTPAPDAATLLVQVKRFDEIDPGDIDLLNLDCEGGERHVLSRLHSQPVIIGVELWHGNPDREWIITWLQERHYQLRATTGPEGETMIWSLS